MKFHNQSLFFLGDMDDYIRPIDVLGFPKSGHYYVYHFPPVALAQGSYDCVNVLAIL